MKRKVSFTRTESDSFAFKRFRELNFTEPRLQAGAPLQAQKFDDAYPQLYYIDADVLIDIFYGFPRRELDKFKSVCKYWFNCASHPKLAWRCLGRWVFDEEFSSLEIDANVQLHPETLHMKRIQDGWTPLLQPKYASSCTASSCLLDTGLT